VRRLDGALDTRGMRHPKRCRAALAIALQMRRQADSLRYIR
jgi:hypothetical protein